MSKYLLEIGVEELPYKFIPSAIEQLKSGFEKFLAEGGNKEDYAPAEEKVVDEFRKTINIYRERRQKYQEEQEAIKLRNLELKKVVLEELKGVVESEDSMKNIYDNFNALQERWKSIGDVPRTEINNLWQSYHFLVEKFFNKVKINKELKMLDLKSETALCGCMVQVFLSQ